MVGYPSAGTGNELFFSIAAAVVGGVSLFGGVGSVLGAMLGALLIATISNGMTLLSVPSFWQPLVIGLIILFGVILDTYRRRFSEVRRAVQVLRSKALGNQFRTSMARRRRLQRTSPENSVLHDPISNPGHEKKTDRESRERRRRSRYAKNQDG